MIARFQGVEGRPRLIAALRGQRIVQDDLELAEAIAEVAEIIQVNPNSKESEIIRQNDPDNDLFMILSGKVSIRINDVEIAIRETGNHVGEMAIIDPTARRIGTVTAVEQTVLAQISESDFSSIANKYSDLWRRLAVELANRLRERNKYVKTPNQIPKLFIGSSSEGLLIAEAIRAKLEYENCEVKVWTDGIFHASKFPVEDLTKAVEQSDFAVLVVTPDDKLTSRKKRSIAPRDNVIFELGLFMGALGRERTFLVKPRSQDIKIPTDLFGLTPMEFSSDERISLDSRIACIGADLKKIIKELGVK